MLEKVSLIVKFLYSESSSTEVISCPNSVCHEDLIVCSFPDLDRDPVTASA